MFSLIITIISIALVTALALATIYYGGSAFKQGAANAKAAQVVLQGQQLLGAAELFHAALGYWPATLQDMVDKNYLKSLPAVAFDAAPSAMRSAFAAADSQWVLPTPGEPTFTLSLADQQAACQAVNLSSWGTAGIPVKAYTGLAAQCYGASSATLLVAVSKNPQGLRPILGATNVVIAAGPAAVTGAEWLAEPGAVTAAVTPAVPPVVTPAETPATPVADGFYLFHMVGYIIEPAGTGLSPTCPDTYVNMANLPDSTTWNHSYRETTFGANPASFYNLAGLPANVGGSFMTDYGYCIPMTATEAMVAAGSHPIAPAESSSNMSLTGPNGAFNATVSRYGQTWAVLGLGKPYTLATAYTEVYRPNIGFSNPTERDHTWAKVFWKGPVSTWQLPSPLLDTFGIAAFQPLDYANFMQVTTASPTVDTTAINTSDVVLHLTGKNFGTQLFASIPNGGGEVSVSVDSFTATTVDLRFHGNGAAAFPGQVTVMLTPCPSYWTCQEFGQYVEVPVTLTGPSVLASVTGASVTDVPIDAPVTVTFTGSGFSGMASVDLYLLVGRYRGNPPVPVNAKVVSRSDTSITYSFDLTSLVAQARASGGFPKFNSALQLYFNENTSSSPVAPFELPLQ